MQNDELSIQLTLDSTGNYGQLGTGKREDRRVPTLEGDVLADKIVKAVDCGESLYRYNSHASAQSLHHSGEWINIRIHSCTHLATSLQTSPAFWAKGYGNCGLIELEYGR